MKKKTLELAAASTLLAWTACGVGPEEDAAALALESNHEEEEEEEVELAYAKLLIEHNATDEDTGFQLAADGEPWKALDVFDPRGRSVLSVRARGRLRSVGLTEMFFETNEPPNAEVPIPEMLSKLPEGVYEYEGRTVEGAEIEGEAILTHAIPAGPVITSPAPGAAVDPQNLQIQWEPVIETIEGDPVDVTHYQVIVEKDAPFDHPGWGRSLFSVHVPATVTSMTIPPEFLEPESAYSFEVLAIEESGNQTISASEFETP